MSAAAGPSVNPAAVQHHARVSPPRRMATVATVEGGGAKTFTTLQTQQQSMMAAEERKLKGEKDMNSLHSNLMEYREAPASPSASSVTTTLSLENCGSPSTPNSPPGPGGGAGDQQEMDDERLPNELLEELCEDIGMKEGMELDFVEFLMEQDVVDPHHYMTPEALRSSGFPTPTNASHCSSTLHTPTSKDSNQQHGWGNRNCGSPSYSIASSTNVTVATSSGSSSPVSKRFHMSNSGPPSPPPLSHTASSHVFKAPQTPPTPRRPIPTSQGAMSPRSNLSVSSNQSSHSDHSNHSSHSSVHSSQSNQLNQGGNGSGRCYSPRTTMGAPSPQLPHSTTGASAFNKPPPQYRQQYQGAGVGQAPTPGQTPGQQSAQKTPMTPTMSQPYQRSGRQVPPNVNVQNFQQPGTNRYMAAASAASASNNQSCAMNTSSTLGNMNTPQGQCQTLSSQSSRPSESPLDQGYFTDNLSSRSFDSSTTSTVPSNVANSVQGNNSQQKMTPSTTTSSAAKSVHFAEGMSANCVRQTEGLPYEPCYRTNVPDCELEEYRNSIQKMQSKMMPRLNHHVKPETAPYTVPSNTGQTTMNPFDYCNNQVPNNMGGMQQQQQYNNFDQKPSGSNFGMDNNQNLVMQNYNENMGPQQQQDMANMNCQMPSSCGGGTPIGPMQQGQQGQQGPQMDPFRGQQSQCQMGGQGKGMYDAMNMQGGMMKNGGHMAGAGGDNNCQFSGQSQGSMGDMMGMGPGGMMAGQSGAGMGQQGQQQGSMTPGFPGGQGYQNSGFPGQQQHRQMAGMNGSGMMGFDGQYDQSRGGMGPGMAGNMNMNSMDNQVYQQNQGTGGEGMGWNNTGGMPGTPQQPHQMGVAPHSAPMNMPGGSGMMNQQGGQCGQVTGVPCAIANCGNCKQGSPNRPPMMASQQRFIQHLITDRSNAFRSHPLFPLLRDLIIADMNFNTPHFPYQLISNLPADFDRLLQNFLHRNPPAGNYQANMAVESVVMDALKYAHHCLIDKIRQKQDQEPDKHSKSTSKSLSAIEEFCEKFDQSVRKSYIKPATLQLGGGVGPGGGPGAMENGGGPGGPGQMGGPGGMMGSPHHDMTTPTKDMKYPMGMAGMMMPGGMFMSPQAKKGLEFGGMMSPSFKSMVDFDGASDCGSMVSSSSHPNKPESKKHPSLPKEAVAIMLDWLRQHKDNPYPNDDEKAMLIKQTGLTINQINYWFTNARRRILPKWAQQCKT